MTWMHQACPRSSHYKPHRGVISVCLGWGRQQDNRPVTGMTPMRGHANNDHSIRGQLKSRRMRWDAVASSVDWHKDDLAVSDYNTARCRLKHQARSEQKWSDLKAAKGAPLKTERTLVQQKMRWR
eukprot:scaffold5723_cov150-Skeletonema_dohrnii-CCMP3373.AAC.4